MSECPNGCDLRGEPIPEDSQHMYGGKTHFSLMTGVEIPEIYDGVLIWYCPKCGMYWPRFSAPDRRHEKALQRIAEWKAEALSEEKTE